MRRYALIGKSLSHSFSKQYFDRKFQSEGLADCAYSLCEMPSLQGLRRWVEREGICGFNVTIPYKREVISHLDALAPGASAIGAVNCVEVTPEGRLVGHNTDAPAFLQTLRPLLPAGVRQALVLGRGGAARAVVQALAQLGIHALTTDRHLRLYGPDCRTPRPDLRPDRVDFGLLVNATPVGTLCDASPWPWPERLRPGAVVYDLVYNPSPTALMRHAAARGAKTQGGLEMLHLQAALGWQIWSQGAL